MKKLFEIAVGIAVIVIGSTLLFLLGLLPWDKKPTR